MRQENMTIPQILTWFSSIRRLAVHYYPQRKVIKVLYRSRNKDVLEFRLEFTDDINVIKQSVYLHNNGRELCSEGVFNQGFMTEFFFTRFLTGQIRSYTGDKIRLVPNKQELSTMVWQVVLNGYDNSPVAIQVSTTSSSGVRKAYITEDKPVATKGFCIEFAEIDNMIQIRYAEYSGKKPRKFNRVVSESNNVDSIIKQIEYKNVI